MLLVCIISCLYRNIKEWLDRNKSRRIINNIINNTDDAWRGPRLNSEFTEHTIVNSGPGMIPADEEYHDPLPLYEPRNTSNNLNTLVQNCDSSQIQIRIHQPDLIDESIDRPPTYRI
jgi:hypothetical protein